MEIQQSSVYADYIRSLGWIVEKIDGTYIFIKPFPIIGGVAKIQRSSLLPHRTRLLRILKKYRVRTLAIEPDSGVRQRDFSRWCRSISHSLRLNRDPFIPTKTIRVDLRAPEDALFQNMTEAKRRAVRRAEKNHITVKHSVDSQTFFRLKNRSAGFLGFITTRGMDKLWDALPEKNKLILLAYTSTNQTTPIAGIFLIFWKRLAYYWIAGATPEGKKLFAPTLLVWEALKVSKKRRCTSLDFLGVWDERKPHEHNEWKGFTKFKEGFGGTALYYPLTHT